MKEAFCIAALIFINVALFALWVGPSIRANKLKKQIKRINHEK